MISAHLLQWQGFCTTLLTGLIVQLCMGSSLSLLVTVPLPLRPCRCKALWMWKQRLLRRLSSWMSRSGT